MPLIAVPGIDKIDVSVLVAEPRNVCLMAEGGCLIFIADEPGIYEIHTNWLKPFRGGHAYRGTKAALRWMFTHTDCMTVRTRVPAFNKPAAHFTRLLGGTKAFERKAVWPLADGGMDDMSFWLMDYEAWLKLEPTLEVSGHEFHVKLDMEYARHGAEAITEPEPCQQIRIGAMVEMIHGGEPEKAIGLYNRWARFAGFVSAKLIARNPLLIDVGGAVLQFDDQTFKVIKCP